MTHTTLFLAPFSWLLLAAAALGDPANQASQQERVEDLVRQLGDEQFRKRESAQRQLLAAGEAILPILDRLGPQVDPEVQNRLRRIRYALVGYAADIERLLRAMPEITDEHKPDLSPELHALIAAQQPRSGDYLLRLIADQTGSLHRRAVNAFVLAWESHDASQIDRYIKRSLTAYAILRPFYPAGVDASIQLGYVWRHGWGGRPSGDGFRFTTHTAHYVDGKPYGKRYTYPYASSGCTTGWVQIDQLQPGRHTLHSVLDYEFLHHGQTVRGRTLSEEFAFEVIDPPPADNLAAPADPELDKMVHAALRFAETENDFKPKGELANRTLAEVQLDPWRPHWRWKDNRGNPAALHTAQWQFNRPLPVDLCFRVDLLEEKTGKSFPCELIVVHRRSTAAGLFVPRDIHGFVANRDGFIAIKAVFKASRGLALTDPAVTRYYTGELTTGVLRLKLFTEYDDHPNPLE
jgi:hypothetical protein